MRSRAGQMRRRLKGEGGEERGGDVSGHAVGFLFLYICLAFSNVDASEGRE